MASSIKHDYESNNYFEEFKICQGIAYISVYELSLTFTIHVNLDEDAHSNWDEFSKCHRVECIQQPTSKYRQ